MPTVLFFALLVAVVLATTLTFAFRSRMRGWGFWPLFGVLFLGGAAVALWVEPIGPVVYGFAWVPVVVGTLMIALMMLALATPPRTPAVRTNGELSDDAVEASWAFLSFLMLALGVLLLASFFR